MCGAERQSSKRRQVDLSSSRSRSNRGVPLRSGYQDCGLPVPDISSQVDFMQALIYPSANIPGWCTAGSKASAWSHPIMAPTRCDGRRRPRFIAKPEPCAQCSFSLAILNSKAPCAIWASKLMMPLKLRNKQRCKHLCGNILKHIAEQCTFWSLKSRIATRRNEAI